MVIPTLGELLPAALAITLSPFPVIAVVVVAGARNAKTSGPAFALGWLLGLGALVAAAVLLLGGGDDVVHDEPGLDWGTLALGVLLLGLAAKKWSGRPRPGEEAPSPAWLSSLDTGAPGRALMLGTALGGGNPKNVALVLAAAATIAEAGLDQREAVWTVIAFTLLASASVLLVTATALVGGSRGAAGLTTVRQFMDDHNVAIVVVVLVLIGGKLIGDGLGGLFA